MFLVIAGIVGAYHFVDGVMKVGPMVILTFTITFLIPFLAGLHSNYIRAEESSFLGVFSEMFGDCDNYKIALISGIFYLLIWTIGAFRSDSITFSSVIFWIYVPFILGILSNESATDKLKEIVAGLRGSNMLTLCPTMAVTKWAASY